MSKILLVDMDGVLVDLLPTWLSIYGDDSAEWIHPDRITQYGHEKFVSEPALFWDSLAAALETAPPMMGSTVFTRLCAKYDTYVVTYAHSAAPRAHAIKLQWMARYFPDFDRDRVIFTKHKHLVRGDVLIEDSQANCEAWDAQNPEGISLLMAAPYNLLTHYSYSWSEIAEVLL